MKHNAIIGILICLSLAFMTTLTEAAIDPDTIVGVWLFDDGQGETASDLSENELHGTLQGGPKWVDGKFGKALELDGVGAYVEIPGHENPRDAITVSIWVKSKTENWNQDGFMVEKRNAFIAHPVVNSKNVGWALCNGACWNKPQNWNTNAAGPDDITEWHLYTLTFDSSTGDWKIYVDEQEVSAMVLDKVPINADTGPVFIGRDSCCAGRFGNVFVDEVAIFNVALGQDEIASMANSGLAPIVASVEAEGKMTTTWGKVKTKY